MFPSAGYFKGLLCPYYVSGLCERPYCHFKHYKPDVEYPVETPHKQPIRTSTDEKDGSVEGYTPTPVQSSSMLNMVGKAIQHVETEIKRDKYRLHNKTSVSIKVEKVEPPKTRITLGSLSLEPVLSDNDDESECGDIPAVSNYEYVPTKIKPMEYTPTPLNVLKNSAKYSTAEDDDMEDQEYDPTSNFKATTNKLTYRTNASTFQYSHEESENEDVGDDGAHFSDDDDYDNDDHDEDHNHHYPMTNYQTSSSKHAKTNNKKNHLDDDVSSNGDDLVSQILNASKAPPKISNEKTGFIEPADNLSLASSRDKSGVTNQSKTKSISKDRSKNIQSLKTKQYDQSKTEVQKQAIQKFVIPKSRSNESREKSQSLHSKGLKPNEKSPRKSDFKYQSDRNDLAQSDTLNKSKREMKTKEQSPKKTRQHELNVSDSSSKSSKNRDRHLFGSIKSEFERNDHSSKSIENYDKHNSSHTKHEAKRSDDSKKSSDNYDKRESGSKKHEAKHSVHSRKTLSEYSDSGRSKKEFQTLDRTSKSDRTDREKMKSSNNSEKASGKKGITGISKDLDNYDRKRGKNDSAMTSFEKKSRDSLLKRKEIKTSSNFIRSPTQKRGIRSGDSVDSDSPSKRQKVNASNVDLFGVDSDSESGASLVSGLFSDFDSYKRLKASTSYARSAFSPLHDEESLHDMSPQHEDNHSHEYSPLRDNITISDNSDSDNDLIESSFLDLSDDDDETINDAKHYKECLQIFNEEADEPVQKASLNRPPVPKIKKEFEGFGKKRLAHASTDNIIVQKKPAPKKRLPTPLTVMQNRLMSLHERSKSLPSKSNAGSSRGMSSSTSRNRHSSAKCIEISDDEDSPTPCQTSSKKPRIAHVPMKKIIKRPIIPPDPSSKVPTNVRMRYLNLLIDECLKIYDQQQDAHNRAVTEEKTIYERSPSKSTYLNVAANTVKRLRHEMQDNDDGNLRRSNGSKVSHAALLDGAKAASVSYTVHRSNSRRIAEVVLNDEQVYNRFLEYAMTPDQMKENGYPFPDPKYPGVAVIKKKEGDATYSSLKTHEKICRRCGASFIVYPNGVYQNKQECIFHWGKAWKTKVSGSWETRYTCCQSGFDVKGCSISKLHVHEMNKTDDLKGYMKTIPCSPNEDGNYGFYSLDCEMVYTSKGCELARVTVIDRELRVVYDSLVQPEKPVVDYNSRFSGLTEKDLMDVTTTLRDVQAILLSMFNSQTILMGHSLESDLVALKLIHPCVVDTSIVFPHRLGPPHKRALRTLMAEIMNKIIQNDVGGHDCSEDASSCMELMLWKIKDDMKKGKNSLSI